MASSPKMSPAPNVASVSVRPAAVLAHGADAPGAHHVARIAAIALPEHHVAGIEMAGHRHRRDLRQILVGASVTNRGTLCRRAIVSSLVAAIV